MASTSSSPTPATAVALGQGSSSPVGSKTPLPNPALKLNFAQPPPSSSPLLLPPPSAKTPASARQQPTPLSAHIRPSSPTSTSDDKPASSSSPNLSPGSYKRRQAKRARAAAAGSPSAVTPAGKELGTALSKKMSEAGCKMGSFKISNVAKAAPGAPSKRKPSSAGAGQAAAVRVVGFRHMSSETPIASRTVAKQPKLEEHKLVSPSKRTFAFSSVSMGPSKSAPGGPAPPAATPSVLMQPTRSADSPTEGEGEPISERLMPFSEHDDAAILRLAKMLKGDFSWVAKAMRPVRISKEVARRHARLCPLKPERPLSTASAATNTPSLKRAPDEVDSARSAKMSKSSSLGGHQSSQPNSLSSSFLIRTPSLPAPKPTTFVIPNPKRNSLSRSTSPAAANRAPSPQALAAAAAMTAASSMTRSHSCSALPAPSHHSHSHSHLKLAPLDSISPPERTAAASARPVLPPLSLSTGMSRAESLNAISDKTSTGNPLRPMMMNRSSSLGAGGAGMVRLPSLREMLAGSQWHA